MAQYSLKFKQYANFFHSDGFLLLIIFLYLLLLCVVTMLCAKMHGFTQEIKIYLQNY